MRKAKGIVSRKCYYWDGSVCPEDIVCACEPEFIMVKILFFWLLEEISSPGKEDDRHCDCSGGKAGSGTCKPNTQQPHRRNRGEHLDSVHAVCCFVFNHHQSLKIGFSSKKKKMSGVGVTIMLKVKSGSLTLMKVKWIKNYWSPFAYYMGIKERSKDENLRWFMGRKRLWYTILLHDWCIFYLSISKTMHIIYCLQL